MSISKVMVSVWDIKGEAFGDPFFRATRGIAIRDFEDAVNAPDSPFRVHPDDFILYELGVFDVRTGVLDMHDSRLELGTARSMIRKDGE